MRSVGRLPPAPAGGPGSILSFGSTTFNPLLSRKNVWSPNNSFNFGTNGWSSGITWASNCVRVCSTCAEFSFITDSIRLLPHNGDQSVADHSCDPTQAHHSRRIAAICPKAECAEGVYPEFRDRLAPYPKSIRTPQPRDPVRSRPL